MGENFEYEEDFSLLGQEDFEVTNSLKFKSTSNLTDTEKKLYDKVKQYINNVFDNVIDSENWAFQSYGIEICPRCSKTTAYCFHGLNTSSKNEKLILHCVICGLKINKSKKLDPENKEERGPFFPGTKIPFYSGVLIKDD
jgi:hypothetical protein